jgi:hypothetical protein
VAGAAAGAAAAAAAAAVGIDAAGRVTATLSEQRFFENFAAPTVAPTGTGATTSPVLPSPLLLKMSLSPLKSRVREAADEVEGGRWKVTVMELEAGLPAAGRASEIE